MFGPICEIGAFCRLINGKWMSALIGFKDQNTKQLYSHQRHREAKRWREPICVQRALVRERYSRELVAAAQHEKMEK